MDDFLPVRVLDRLAHGAKKSQAIFDCPFLPAAVVRETDASDILHDEPRRSVGQRARVIEARNIRMLKLGESLDFWGKALAACGGKPGVRQKLDGHQITSVSAFAEPHHAHSA